MKQIVFSFITTILICGNLFATKIEILEKENNFKEAIEQINTSATLLPDEIARLTQWFVRENRFKWLKRLSEKLITLNDFSPHWGKLMKHLLLELTKEDRAEDDIRYTIDVLRYAGKIQDTELVLSIFAFSVHPRQELRQIANEILSARRDDRIYPLMAQLLQSSNVMEKNYAIDTMVLLKDERTGPLLTQALSDTNKTVRYYALKALDTVRFQGAQFTVIQVAQSDVDEEIRLKAVAVLGNIRTPNTLFALHKLIADVQPKIREAALNAILLHREQRSASILSEQLARETDATLKKDLIQALFQLNSGGGMAGFFTLMKNESDEQLLLWSIHAAAVWNDSRSPDMLFLLFEKDKRPSIIAEIAAAWGSLKSKKYLIALKQTLEEAKNDYLPRASALVAIELLDQASSIPVLFEIYDRENDQKMKLQIAAVIRRMMQKSLPKFI